VIKIAETGSEALRQPRMQRYLGQFVGDGVRVLVLRRQVVVQAQDGVQLDLQEKLASLKFFL
jgi:hypothetical protein